jgi:branched-chain amino acid transport system permease protein
MRSVSRWQPRYFVEMEGRHEGAVQYRTHRRLPRSQCRHVNDFVNQVLEPGLVSGATAGLFALAFVVVYRVTGVLNFAHGQLVMLMPLAVLVLTNRWGVPLVTSFALAVAVVLGTGLIEERVAIRPFMGSGHALTWMLSTLGFSVVLAELMAIPYKGQTVAFPWGVSAKAHDAAGVTFSWTDVATVGAFVLLVVILVVLERRTIAGLRLRAVSQDTLGAAALGISPGAASRTAVGIASVIAIITGLLLVSTQLVTSGVGLTVLFNGFIAAAVGGLDSIAGTLVGGLVVGVVGQAAAVHVDGVYVHIVLFSVLLLICLFKPHGIFGRVSVRAV